MTFDFIRTDCWYPTEAGGETLRQREEAVAKSWLEENLSPAAQVEWRNGIRGCRTKMEPSKVLGMICRHDSAELAELLYPRFPGLFQKARQYTLSPTLLTCLLDAPFSAVLLQQCIHARTAHLDATCLFALCGAAGCLEKLLEYGADPDGLDTPDSWSYLELPAGQILPVSPLDCALLSDSGDCRLLLEMFGGKTLHENLPAL